MRFMRNFLALVFLGWATASAAGVGDAVVIRSLRYSMEGDTGKLLIGTDGIPVVVTGGTNSLVTLAFRHATVSSPPGAAHVYFTEGPMRSAVIDRSASDSVTVTVRLRVQGRIDLGLEGHDVVLRVIPHGSAGERVSRSFAPVTALLSSELKSPATGASSESRSALSGRGLIPPVGLFTLVGLLAFAGLTSCAFALAVVRRLGVSPQTVELQPVERAEEERYDEEEPGIPIADLPSPYPEEEEVAETEDEIDARAYQLAKALRRGKGEMDLALRMQSKREEVLGEKISKSCRTPKTKAQRVQNAKRLGVGRGEIDLALRLKKMIPVSNAVEEQ